MIVVKTEIIDIEYDLVEDNMIRSSSNLSDKYEFVWQYEPEYTCDVICPTVYGFPFGYLSYSETIKVSLPIFALDIFIYFFSFYLLRLLVLRFKGKAENKLGGMK
jgi:hypothetical protein